MQIRVNKQFIKDLKGIIANYPSISHKLSNLQADIHQYGFSYQLFQTYDIKSLGDGFFRIKFIPLRIIVFIKDNVVYFDKIFKRKGPGDYKFTHP